MGCSRYTSDVDYVDAIKGGGSGLDLATECLYRAYRDRVLMHVQNYVGYRSGQREDIGDLVQDAYLIMIEKIRFGGYKDGSLLHFWIGITKGLLRNKVKRDARMDLVDDTLKLDQKDLDSPEYQLISEERSSMLDQLLSRLGERCKRVLVLWASGYSMREIAEKLGLSSEAMARKTKYKCKGQLLALVDSVDIDL